METVDELQGPAWGAAFEKALEGIHGAMAYQESAGRLRKLLEHGLLKLDDIERAPERFFEAHRLLAKRAPALGSGFWVRFTVQYNLFAGTVVGLGSKQQRDELAAMQQRGTLGCFGLTERFAGVNSGLVVNTTATWNPDRQCFVLNTPNDGACKNWISQGLTADKAVVVADLRVRGKSHGPHAFLMTFRENGGVVPGITIGDMGRKTIGNDLDNVWIRFDDVPLHRNALLSRYAKVENDEYVGTKGVRTMEMIGQRLFTGRVAVAQAALTFARGLFDSTKAYSDAKACWAPSGATLTLSSVPQLRALYAEAYAKLDELDAFAATIERELCGVLRGGGIPRVELQQAIAVAKVHCVGSATQLCWRLKQEVGSYGLMGGTGFENIDFLLCCAFAEGDGRVLQQKMARDAMAAHARGADAAAGPEVTQRCVELARELKNAQAKGATRQQAWDSNWDRVYGLAEAVIAHTVRSFASAPLSKL